MNNLLEQLITLVVEKRVREADITGGKRVRHGSREHIKDLTSRIAELNSWRMRQKKGSEARANYSRLISKLRSELNSARRAFVAPQTKKKAAKEPEKIATDSINEVRPAGEKLVFVRDDNGRLVAPKSDDTRPKEYYVVTGRKGKLKRVPHDDDPIETADNLSSPRATARSNRWRSQPPEDNASKIERLRSKLR